MAKLIVLSLAFTALVAFSTAHSTIITTTVDDQGSQQCSRQLRGERFNQCQMYLSQQGSFEDDDIRGQHQQGGLQMCCQELRRVDEECQCEAVKQVFQETQQQQIRQQGGRFGAQQIQQLKQKAQNLPNKCNLQTQQCQIRALITTTTVTDDIYDSRSSRGSQQCRQIVEQQSFNQCQKFIGQEIRSPRTLLMSISKQGQQQKQALKQCCNELENVMEDCQCEAMKEVYRKVIRQQEQGSRFGGQQQQQMEEVRRMIQNLSNQCDLEVEQCRIPSEMF